MTPASASRICKRSPGPERVCCSALILDASWYAEQPPDLVHDDRRGIAERIRVRDHERGPAPGPRLATDRGHRAHALAREDEEREEREPGSHAVDRRAVGLLCFAELLGERRCV